MIKKTLSLSLSLGTKIQSQKQNFLGGASARRSKGLS